MVVPAPERFEHDAAVAWRDGPRRALTELGDDLDVRGVSVAAMVPSLTAVDDQGTPLSPGLLYGDERGRTGVVSQAGTDDASGGFLGYVRWQHETVPAAHGYWPAQAVANHALAGEAVLDTTTASLAHPLFDFTGWDAAVVDDLGITTGQLPRLVPTGWECGKVDGDGPALASGCIDAMAEQLVAGADRPGDVLVLLGTTLIVWVVAHEGAEVPGYVTIPHTASGNYLVGGPSNVGGLFRDWATRMLAPPGDRALDPAGIPVWVPYPRGERVPLNDHTRRASLHRLDLTHDAAAVVRATDEASAFVVKRAVDAAVAHAGVRPERVVASGGGTRVRRVGTGHRRCHRPAGRLRRSARGRRARLGVAGPHRGGPRGADRDDRGPALGTGGQEGRAARRVDHGRGGPLRGVPRAQLSGLILVGAGAPARPGTRGLDRPTRGGRG